MKESWLESMGARIFTRDDHFAVDLDDQLLGFDLDAITDDSKNAFFCYVCVDFIVWWFSHLTRVAEKEGHISLMFDDYEEMKSHGAFDIQDIYLRTLMFGFDGTPYRGMGKEKPLSVMKVRPLGLRPPLTQLRTQFFACFHVSVCWKMIKMTAA